MSNRYERTIPNHIRNNPYKYRHAYEDIKEGLNDYLDEQKPFEPESKTLDAIMGLYFNKLKKNQHDSEIHKAIDVYLGEIEQLYSHTMYQHYQSIYQSLCEKI